MRDYKQVVRDRFDKDNRDAGSIYSEEHPVAKYIRAQLFSGIDWFLEQIKKSHPQFGSLRLLDVGCGNGGMIQFFISRGINPALITSVDLSETRIAMAKEKYPDVKFEHQDALSFRLGVGAYDLITAFDLFSHLSTKEQILQGLRNIRQHLHNDGYFLWYDIHAQDHFSPPSQKDSWGFSLDQMNSLAAEAGWRPVYAHTFFKAFFGRYHSAYQVRRLPSVLVRTLESILPGPPGNLMVVYKKQD